MIMRRLEYKWAVGIVFVLGLFMDLLDMTIVNVALPRLGQEFNARTSAIEWVVIAYLLSLAIFIPVSGWAGDRFGTKRIFLVALSIFTMGSFLCATATNIEALITFRLIQGVGGGMLTPVGTAMVFRAFPPSERAAASSILTIPAVVAPATGPVLGGYLTDYLSWHWIFLVNIPIGLAGLAAAFFLLREERQTNAGRFDLPGFILSSAGLASLLYALAEAGPRGFGAAQVIVFGLGGLGLLTVFVFIELRTREPMIDVRLLGNSLFRAGLALNMIGVGSYLGTLFLLPLLLQAERGLDAFHSGLTTFPQALGVMMMVRPAGLLYHRIGPRRMMMFGMATVALTTAAFVFVDLKTSVWWVRLIMLARGWFFAFLLVPLQAATFATVRAQDTGRASSIFNAGRQVGSSLSVALLATALTSRLTYHNAGLGDPRSLAGAVSAFHEAFLFASFLALIGVGVAAFIKDRDAVSSMRARPSSDADREMVARGTSLMPVLESKARV